MAWTWWVHNWVPDRSRVTILCIHLRMSREGAFVLSSVNSWVLVEFGFIQFALGSFYAVYINALPI